MARRLVPLLFVACFALLVLAFAGCGGDGDSSASDDTVATETTTTEETETTEAEDTETTETEETEDTETTETETSPGFASTENCQEFAQIGAKISEAFTGAAGENLDSASDAFAELTAAAPDEIKDDFQVIADAYNKLADALQGVDVTSTNPDPEALAKLTAASQSIDQAALTQASENIAAWAQENC